MQTQNRQRGHIIKALSKLTVITGELIPKESGDQFAYFIYKAVINLFIIINFEGI